MDSNGLQRAREDIIRIISEKGPSLPAAIASELRIQLLFISAFLSELYREERVKMSHLKIGTSSLYYLPGQEKTLENFIQHMNPREREAFNLVKSNSLLKDTELSPVMRVAIREIKDFAAPIEKNGEVYWKYIFSENVTIPEVKENSQKNEEQKVEPEKEKVEEPKEEKAEEKPKRTRTHKKKSSPPVSVSLTLNGSSQIPLSEFTEEIKQFLTKNSFLNIEVIKSDKKECVLKAALSQQLGNKEYLIFAKDKKTIKQEEIAVSLQEAHNNKLLCIVMSRGDVDKKSSTFIEEWSNFLSHIKIE